MSQIVCVNCWQGLGLLSGKIRINDGYICRNCLRAAKIQELENPLSFTASRMSHIITSRIPVVRAFSPTRKIKSFLQIDEVNKGFRIGNDIFLFSDLSNFGLMEDGETITEVGLGRAIAGALVFGKIGAIVGGLTGARRNKGICHSMRIKVSLRNAHRTMLEIPFISDKTETDSDIYKKARDHALQCLSALQVISDTNNPRLSEPRVNPQMNPSDEVIMPRVNAQVNPAIVPKVNTQTSPADEIMKYKELLDAGAITQFEFDLKKRQLLGF